MNTQSQIRKMLVIGCLLWITVFTSAQELMPLPYQAGWITNLDTWEVVDNKYESKTWNWKAEGVAYITDSKKANNDWLVSPAIDCSGKGAKKVSFGAAWNKAQSSNIALYYSINYQGDQSAADWVLVEEKIIPDSHPYGFKTAGFMPFSAKVKVDAPKVHFAIRYMPHNQTEGVQNEIRVRNFKITSKN